MDPKLWACKSNCRAPQPLPTGKFPGWKRIRFSDHTDPPRGLQNEAYMPLADTPQSITLGSADATAPKADPPERSPTESDWCRRARTARARRSFPGTPERRLRLRPDLYQPGRARNHQSDREPAVANRRCA